MCMSGVQPPCEMYFFLVTCCFSFIFFYHSLAISKPLPSWASEMRLLSLSSFFNITKSIRNAILGVILPIFASRMSSCKKKNSSKVESVDNSSEMSLLDLPDLVLESILEKLPPEELCKMGSVCTILRERCMSDHLWEKLVKNKWGRILGPSVYREWQWYSASRKGSVFFNQSNPSGLMGYLNQLWPVALIRSSFSNKNNFPPLNSTMSLYLALESGRFWFPGQVYNRENGHIGFMLSCYDAELRYDQHTDTFEARYPPHGRRASPVESGITWDRLRAPPIDTSPHDLHTSDCLNELKPGDHIEIQWRRNKEFPYGWWYGVVGHLETCDGNANYCRCHDNDTAMLEFNQYGLGSRWRKTAIDRKHHREEGNEADGFYAGIRKLCSKEEISTWKRIWPSQELV